MPATVYSIKDNSPIDLRTLADVSVVVTVPAAFSGTCTNVCVPEIAEASGDLLSLGAKRIIIVSSDQPHAIKQWVESAGWKGRENLTFASDFGKFEMRSIVGKLSDEEGKHDLSPSLGELIRRSYSVIRGGNIVWQYLESDTSEFTLNMDELKKAVKHTASKA